MRNKLKDVLRGTGDGSVKKEPAKRAISGRTLLNSTSRQQHHQPNGKSEISKEIDELNLKLLTMEKRFEMERANFAKEKKQYKRNLEGLNEKVSIMKDKVIMANEQISDLEETLKVKNERISALTAELEVMKSSKANTAHEYDSINDLSRSKDTKYQYLGEDDDSIVDLNTRKLLQLNMRTMEFEYDPSLDQTTNMFTRRTDAGSLAGGEDTMDMLLRGTSKSNVKTPIYNSNPRSKGLDSDDELYLQSSQFRGVFNRRSSFDLDTALKDSTEKIAGVY